MTVELHTKHSQAGVIYMLKNASSGKAYVGQTTNLQRRWAEHRASARSGSRLHLHASMRKYGEEAFSVSVLEECDVSKLDERERFWIEKLETFTDGYNLTMGGDGVRGLKWTPERLQAASKPVVAYSPSTQQQVMQFSSLNDVRRSLGKVLNVGAACKGDLATAYGLVWKFADCPLTNKDIERVKLRYTRVARSVSQYSLAGELISTFVCAAEAARNIGLSVSNIHTACKKRTTCAGGSLWRYSEQGAPSKEELAAASLGRGRGGYAGKRVQLVAQNGYVEKEFVSAAAAARELGLKQHQVIRVAYGRMKSLDGFTFRFCDDAKRSSILE
jgi:group I intron endonuclease